MIPKTELVYSFPYNHLFNNNFTYLDLEKLNKMFSNFEKLYLKYIKQILILIERSNETWKRKYIPIYLTEKTRPISNPLTLRYEKNEKCLLIVLIHELIHNNLTRKFMNREELHKYISEITKKVCSELDLELDEEVGELDKRILQSHN